MLIKHSGVYFQAPKHFHPIYFILGSELFQTNNVANALKTAWKQHFGNDINCQSISAESATEWASIELEVTSYSLFSSQTLLDISYDKKSLESSANHFFQKYLPKINSDCVLIFRMPNLPIKQLQSFTNHEAVQVIQCVKPSRSTLLQWITSSLNQICKQYDPSIPNLIDQYNEGNLFACSQVLEKLSLITENDQALTLETVKEQLIDQCNYTLFELGEACLTGNTVKVIQLLRHAQHTKTEPTLVLWCLTQEIRILLQLHPVAKNMQAFRNMANSLKIWTSRLPLYQSQLQNYTIDLLQSLLQFCSKLDNFIKTGKNKQTWQLFECIALSLCTKQRIGYIKG